MVVFVLQLIVRDMNDSESDTDAFESFVVSG